MQKIEKYGICFFKIERSITAGKKNLTKTSKIDIIFKIIQIYEYEWEWSK